MWIQGLPVGVKQATRVRACVIEGGAVKVSLGETVARRGKFVRASLGDGESLGLLRVDFFMLGENGGDIQLNAYKKGGAYFKAQFTGGDLGGLGEDMTTLHVVEDKQQYIVVRLPAKVMVRSSGEIARAVAVASDALNMVQYLNKKGYKCTRLGLNVFKVDGKQLTKVECLKKVNQYRSAEGLRSLMMTEVE